MAIPLRAARFLAAACLAAFVLGGCDSSNPFEDDSDGGGFVPVEVAPLNCPPSLETGESGTFTAEVNEGEATGTVASSWAFGDGADATGLTATHAYEEPGRYDVVFTASNEGEGRRTSADASCSVEVGEGEDPQGAPAIISINAEPSPSGIGEPVSFTVELEGDATIDCEWDFDNGESASGCEVSHAYDATGEYTVRLVAENSVEADAATLAHRVERGQASGVLFVAAQASGANNGTSWSDAFTTLQSALSAARAGDEIWVARGTYYPDGSPAAGGDRSATFRLRNDVALYGGFSGIEETRSARDRDPATNETFLSGDIGEERYPNDNSYHVVTGSGTGPTAVLDGFTVTAGRADANGDESGAGILNRSGSPAIRGVIFEGNEASGSGGGMSNTENSRPRVTEVRFESNVALVDGGAVNNSAGSRPSFSNVVFVGNRADDDGGAMQNNGSSSLTITGATFEGNSAGDNGGAMVSSGSSASALTDIVFASNSAGGDGGGLALFDNSGGAVVRSEFLGNTANGNGGGLYSSDSSPYVANAFFAGNGAAASGGGAYSEGESARPTFANAVFSGNEADRDGGGLYVDETSTALLGTTFSRNTASDDGGALYLTGLDDDRPVVLRNSILYGNNASDDGSQILLYYSEGALLAANTLVENGLPEGAYDGEDNLSSDPLFVDANGTDNLSGTSDDNLRLQGDSPAINAGDSGALPRDEQDLDGDGDTTEPLPVDLDGEARVVGGRVDLGAYER